MMADYLLMFIAGCLLFIVIVLVWLLREQKKIKHDYLVLAERLRRNHEDVTGLCCAAVEVDKHLADNDLSLNSIIERLNSIIDLVNTEQRSRQQLAQPKNEDLGQDYADAIQKIRRGAGVDELVKDCRLTRDEAVLLVRLHAGKPAF